MLGAYTPTEAQLAHEAGADFVKIFPADSLGPAYIKALRAPLPHLQIVADGGRGPENDRRVFEGRLPGGGCGSSLVTREILENQDWPQLTRRAAQFVRAANVAR